MRTEIKVNDLNRAAYVTAAHSQASVIDAANGHGMQLGQEGTRGLIVTIKNTGAAQKSVTIVGHAHYPIIPDVMTIPAGETALLTGFDGSRHGGHGSLDLDFEAGFKGEIAAFRLPRR